MMHRVLAPGYTSVVSSRGMLAMEQSSVLEMVHVCGSKATVAGAWSACRYTGLEVAVAVAVADVEVLTCSSNMSTRRQRGVMGTREGLQSNETS